jgi:hypothetical protein
MEYAKQCMNMRVATPAIRHDWAAALINQICLRCGLCCDALPGALLAAMCAAGKLAACDAAWRM